MTVQNQNVKNVYRGNGSATVFPFTFAINKEHPEYIHVYITNDGDKAVETNDFTCDMEAKTITYPKTTSSAAKLSSTQRLTIYRLLPYTQELNLVNQGPFFAEDVETELDDLEMQIQQMSENLARCFQIGVEAVDFDMTMELEPDKVICVNSTGNGFEARKALMEVNGTWDGEGRRIVSVADPISAQDVLTRHYYDKGIDNMLHIAGIVTDSGELQHIVNQFNTIDTNTQKAVNAANTATIKEASATASATSAAGSATSATNTANALVNFLETKETLTAPAVDPTLTISDAAADAMVTGQIRTDVGITKTVLTLTSGHYINVAGGKSAGSAYSYSNPVAVSKGQSVRLVANGGSTAVAVISTCNADASIITPRLMGTDFTVRTYIYDVLEDGYVMFCFHTAEGYDVSILGEDSNIVLADRVYVTEYAIDNDLAQSIISSETFEQGSYNNGSKVNSNFTIRIKDGYYVTNPSKIIVVPNGQYTYISAWYHRTEVDGVIQFSDIAMIDEWSDQPKVKYAPANCYVLVIVRKTYPTNTTTRPADNLVQVYVADNQIFKNRADIIDLDSRVSALEEEVPSYWQTEIERVKTAINTNRLTIGNRIAEFFFITDLHWRLNAKKSILLMDALKKYSGIKTLLIGGDVVCTHTESQITAIEELREFYKNINGYRTISTMGNHDFNNNNNSSHPEAYISANQFYSACMTDEELFTNTNASPYVTIYDNESQKVRLIQFYHPNPVSIPADVQAEVIDAVQAKGTDWTVFMMCHVYWSGGSVDQYITTFTQQLAGLNASGQYAKIGALIVGHMHDDKSIVVDNNLLVIGSNCDIYRQTQGESTMNEGTDTEQSFDVFQVDLANRTIYITRVGAGNDRQFSY